MKLGRVLTLFKLEWQSEMRRPQAMGALLLYVFATCFVAFMAFKTGIQPPAWNALFWVIVLFAATYASSRAVGAESKGSRLYHYFIFHPLEYFFGKMCWNLLLMIQISAVTFLFLGLFIKNPVQDVPLFLLITFAGSACMAASLSLVNCIAARASGGFALSALLAFPVLIPVLTVSVKGSKNAMDGLDTSLVYPQLAVLLLLFVAINALSVLLFPFVWKD